MDINEVLDEFLTNYNKLRSFGQLKHNELSKVDLELSDFYHKIEGIHLSHNTQGHGLILELKDILARRRTIKKEATLIRSFVDLTQSSMDKARSSKDSINKKHKKLLNDLKKNAE